MKMSDLSVITNNQPRELLYWHNLTPAEQEEFDYLDSDEKRGEAEFIRYRGTVYDLGEFTPTVSPKGWTNYKADSYFSGLLVRFIDHGERVIVGRYYS